MNTEPEVTGTHHGVNLYPIPNYSRYLVSKCGKVFSKRRDRWMLQQICQRGYPRVTIFRDDLSEITVKVHRLLGETFLSVDGLEVDHINRVKTDNRLENLRAVTRAQNMQNQVASGVQKKPSGWTARVRHHGKRLYLGVFKTEEEAHQRYLEKKRELCHIP